MDSDDDGGVKPPRHRRAGVLPAPQLITMTGAADTAPAPSATLPTDAGPGAVSGSGSGTVSGSGPGSGSAATGDSPTPIELSDQALVFLPQSYVGSHPDRSGLRILVVGRRTADGSAISRVVDVSTGEVLCETVMQQGNPASGGGGGAGGGPGGLTPAAAAAADAAAAAAAVGAAASAATTSAGTAAADGPVPRCAPALSAGQIAVSLSGRVRCAPVASQCPPSLGPAAWMTRAEVRQRQREFTIPDVALAPLLKAFKTALADGNRPKGAPPPPNGVSC